MMLCTMTKDLAQLTQIEATFTHQNKRLKCIWKYGETKAVGSEQLISQIGPEYNEMINLYQGFEIEVLFDPYLGGIKLLNYGAPPFGSSERQLSTTRSRFFRIRLTRW
jgi:hypothetical protein